MGTSVNKFLKILPPQPSFAQKGFRGFSYCTSSSDYTFSFIQSKTGHDNFVINSKSTHIYYIIKGSGSFIVENEEFPVAPGNLVEVPPNKEFAYTGTMELLLYMSPPFLPGNETVMKANPAVR